MRRSLHSSEKIISLKRAMDKAIAAIKYSEKCEYDIRQKLQELCYDNEVVETTVEKLKNINM